MDSQSRSRRIALNLLFDQLLPLPAIAGLSDRLREEKAMLACGLASASHPFFAALIRRLIPELPLVVVADGVKSQEVLFQDLETWGKALASKGSKPHPLLYFPSWEVLPHEDKLPHSDVISERLETLLALGQPTAGPSPIIVTNIQAMVQRTFPPRDSRQSLPPTSPGRPTRSPRFCGMA